MGIAGWWYKRNLQLYSGLFGMKDLLLINGLRSMSVTWAELLGMQVSFWGLSGWFSMPTPTRTYSVFAVLSAFSLVGVAVIGIRLWKMLTGRRSTEIDVQSTFITGLASLWTLLMALMMVSWLS